MNKYIQRLKDLYKGRVGRRRFTVTILVAGLGLAAFVINVPPEILNTWYVLVPYYLALIPLSYYITCLYIRRLHDIGLSGYYVTLLFVPAVFIWLGFAASSVGSTAVVPLMLAAGAGQLVNIILTLILVFKRGEQNDNRFGPVLYRKNTAATEVTTSESGT